MSKRLGSEGKTLSVLAEDVTFVSSESNDFVTQVVEILKSIDHLAISLSRSGIDESDNSSDSFSKIIGEVSEVYERFHINCDLSIERSKSLKNMVLQAEEALLFLTGMEAQLNTYFENLDAFGERLSPFIDYSDISMDDLKGLENRYTMENERGVHNRTLGLETALSGMTDKNKGKQRQSQANNLIQEIDEGDDNLGDNVELF